MADKLVLVGAGNMGGALLAGWLNGNAAFDISVIDPKPSDAMAIKMASHGVAHFADAGGAPTADYLVVAVKPQMMSAVLPALAVLVGSETVVISVAAGTSIASLAAPFGKETKVVRVMPNTPALVGRGMSVCFANEKVSATQRAAINGLMAAVGEVAWIDDEGQMDAVTGVSGSGPAYVFHLAEALAAAGVAAGLDEKLADQLARATVCGAGELIAQSSDDPATLRRNVTSPNGTTQAALEVLMGKGGFPDLLPRAVKAAADRSRELSKE